MRVLWRGPVRADRARPRLCRQPLTTRSRLCQLTMPPPADSDIGVVSAPAGACRRPARACSPPTRRGQPVTRLTTCDRETRPLRHPGGGLGSRAHAPGGQAAHPGHERRREDHLRRRRSLAFLDLTPRHRGHSSSTAATARLRHRLACRWAERSSDSALGTGDHEDLFVMDPNGANNQNLTLTPAVDERRLRRTPPAPWPCTSASRRAPRAHLRVPEPQL